MNKVFMIGRLTKDPEIRITQTGKKVASFSIAVNDGKDANGQELTQYFNCSSWEKLAEIIEKYVKKGTRVAVIGRLQNRSWDKPDGTKGYATDLSVRELEILTSRAEAQAMQQQSSSSETQSNPNSQNKQSLNQNDKKAPEEQLPNIDVNDLEVSMPF